MFKLTPPLAPLGERGRGEGVLDINELLTQDTSTSHNIINHFVTHVEGLPKTKP